MGTINIRFRQQGLGNLPGVRQVDTSPLNAVANQDLEAARGLARTMDDLVQGGLRLGNAIVEMKAEDNRNEANRLYKDYVTYMDSLTSQAADPNNPNGGKEGLFLTAERDDNAAKNLAADLRKGQADMRKAIGLDKANARVKELFEELAFSYDRGNALRADGIMAKRFHESRVSNAAAATETARIQAAKIPSAESFDTYARLLEDSFNARGLAEGERVLQRKAAQEGLLTSILAERVKTGSLADTGALLKALAQDTLPPQAGMDERAHAFLQETLKGLAPEVKATLIKALETERDTLAGRQVDAMVTAQSEGRAVYADLVAQRDAFRAAGVPEAIIARADGVIEAQLQCDSNAAILGIPDATKNESNPALAEAWLDQYEAILPDHVRKGTAWQTFRAQAKRVSPKTAAAMKKEAADERVSQITNRWRYDENGARVPVDLGQSEQLEAVALLWRTGQLDDAGYQDACNKINASWDARTADLMRQSTLANDFLEGFAYGEDWAKNGAEDFNLAVLPHAFVFDKTGVDEDKTATRLAALFDTSTDTEAQRANRIGLIRERLHKAETYFARAVAENPSWTSEQCRKLWRELMREPLYALGNEAFEMDDTQAAKWGQALGALYQAADPRADSMDYDADKVLAAFQTLDLTLTPNVATGAPGPLDMAGMKPKQEPEVDYASLDNVDYVTQEGDTAEGLRARYALSPQEFSALTGLLPEGPLKPGQRIRLIDATQDTPLPTARTTDGQPAAEDEQATPEADDAFIVAKDYNNRLDLLALEWKVPVESLRALNPNLSPDGTIPPGTRVRMPKGFRESPPAKSQQDEPAVTHHYTQKDFPSDAPTDQAGATDDAPDEDVPPEPGEETVEDGATFFTPAKDTVLAFVAADYGVSVDDLLAANPGLSRDKPVPAGTKIRLPASTKRHNTKESN